MARGALEAGAHASSPSSRGGELASLRAHAARIPCPPGSCRAPRSARWSRRCSSRSSGWASMPEAHALLVQGAGAARAPARPRAGPRSTGDGEPGRASSRGGSAARSRSSTAVARSVRSRRCAGSATSTRTRSRRRSGPQHPELDHNEICGWGQHGDVTRQILTLVELRHGCEHARLAPRFDCVARDPRGVRRVRCSRCRRRGRAGSRSCSTSCTSATGRAATSRSTTTSTPARSTRSRS